MARSARDTKLRAWALVLSTGLLATGGCGQSTVVKPPSLQPVPCTKQPQKPLAIRKALISIRYHSMAKRPALPPELMPEPLMRAARTLCADAPTDGFGEARRRRAVRDLVVGGLEFQQDNLPPTISPSHQQAINLLLNREEWSRDLNTMILTKISDAFPSKPPDFDGDFWELETTEELLEEIQKVQDQKGLAIAGCQAGHPFPLPIPSKPPEVCSHSDPKWHEGMSWERFSFGFTRTGKSLNEVAAGLDPQHWDACESGGGTVGCERCNPFFESAYVVDSSDDPESCPPAAGSTYSTTPLYEKVLMDYEHQNGGSTHMELATVLSIGSGPIPSPPAAAPGHLFEYCLKKHKIGRLLLQGSNANYVEGLIDVDEGAIRIEHQVGNDFQFIAEKRLRLVQWAEEDGTPWTSRMRAGAAVGLEAMGAASAESVCCSPPPPTSCLGAPGQPVTLPN